MAGSLKAVQTIGRMLMHKKQSKQQVGSLRAVQTRGKMLMYKNNAMQTIKPYVILNLMLMGNNNNENSCPSEQIPKDSDSFFSERIINENQSFVSEQ